jgi:uncharacterized membrane protein (UPF0182 family)
MDGRSMRWRPTGKAGLLSTPKQQLMYGPMQIESRIDQDQNISKDLTLWNQQGSRVLRGNIIALPVTGGFLYLESIYIQATEARMPQLKKVVLAMGDRLIYRDTFDEALADLTSAPMPAAVAPACNYRRCAQREERIFIGGAPSPASGSGRTVGTRVGEAGEGNRQEIELASGSGSGSVRVERRFSAASAANKSSGL